MKRRIQGGSSVGAMVREGNFRQTREGREKKK
jgi:hypothetical protein